MLLRNFKGFQNKGKDLSFEIKKDGKLVNLVGKTGYFKVYLDIPSENEEYIIEKEIEIIDYDLSIAKIILTDTDMEIDTAVYNYILEIEMDSDLTEVFYYGTFEVLGDDTNRLKEIKQIYGLEFEDYHLTQAYNFAHSEILKNVYEKVENETYSKSNLIKIDNFVMDKNFDGIVDENDIEIIQFMKVPPYTVVNLSSQIDDITFNHPIGKTLIELKNEYPTAGYVLRTTYYKGVGLYSDYKQIINRIEELYIIIYLFRNLDAFKLQRGLPDRSINGVDIKYDREGVQSAIKSFMELLNNEISKIKPIQLKGVLINKGYTR